MDLIKFKFFASVFILMNTETFALDFIDVNQRQCYWSMITKNCANQQSELVVTFYDLKINLFLSGVYAG